MDNDPREPRRPLVQYMKSNSGEDTSREPSSSHLQQILVDPQGREQTGRSCDARASNAVQNQDTVVSTTAGGRTPRPSNLDDFTTFNATTAGGRTPRPSNLDDFTTFNRTPRASAFVAAPRPSDAIPPDSDSTLLQDVPSRREPSEPSALEVHYQGVVPKRGRHKICVKLMQKALQRSLMTRLDNGIDIFPLERFLVLILNSFLRLLLSACRCKCDAPRQVSDEHQARNPEGLPKDIAKKMKAYEKFLLALGAGPSLHVNIGLLQEQLTTVKVRLWVYALMIVVFHPIVSILFGVCVVTWTTWESSQALGNPFAAKGFAADVIDRVFAGGTDEQRRNLADRLHRSPCLKLCYLVLRAFVGIVFLVGLLIKFCFFLGLWSWVAGWVPMVLAFHYYDNFASPFTNRKQFFSDLVRHILLFPAGGTAYSACALILVLYTVARNTCSMQGVLARWRLLGRPREFHESSASALVSLHFTFAEVWPENVWAKPPESLISIGSDAYDTLTRSGTNATTNAGGNTPPPRNPLSLVHIFTNFDPLRNRQGSSSNSSSPSSFTDAIDNNPIMVDQSPAAGVGRGISASSWTATAGAAQAQQGAATHIPEIRQRPILLRPLCCFDDARKPPRRSKVEQQIWYVTGAILAGVSAGSVGAVSCFQLHRFDEIWTMVEYIVTFSFCAVIGYFVAVFVKNAFQSAHTGKPPGGWKWLIVGIALIHGLLPMFCAWASDQWKSYSWAQITIIVWAAYPSVLCIYLVVWSISASITETEAVARQLGAVTSLICRRSARQFLVHAYMNVEARTPDWDREGNASKQGKFAAKWSCWSARNGTTWEEEDQPMPLASDTPSQERSCRMKCRCGPPQVNTIRRQTRLQELYMAMSFFACDVQGPADITAIRSMLTKTPTLSMEQKSLPMQDEPVQRTNPPTSSVSRGNLQTQDETAQRSNSPTPSQEASQAKNRLGSCELAVKQDEQIRRKINGFTDFITVEKAIEEVNGKYYCSPEVISNRQVWIKHGEEQAWSIQWFPPKSSIPGVDSRSTGNTTKGTWAICYRYRESERTKLSVLYWAVDRDDMLVPEDDVWENFCVPATAPAPPGGAQFGNAKVKMESSPPPAGDCCCCTMDNFKAAVSKLCRGREFRCCFTAPEESESMEGLSDFVDDFVDQVTRGPEARQGRQRDVVAIFGQLRLYVVMEMLTMKSPLEFLLGIVIALLLFLVVISILYNFCWEILVDSSAVEPLGKDVQEIAFPVIGFDLLAITIVVSRAMWRCCEVNQLLARHAGLLRTLAVDSRGLSIIRHDPAIPDDAADAALRKELRDVAAYAKEMADLIDRNDTKIRLFGLEITYAKVVSLSITLFSALATKAVTLLL